MENFFVCPHQAWRAEDSSVMPLLLLMMILFVWVNKLKSRKGCKTKIVESWVFWQFVKVRQLLLRLIILVENLNQKSQYINSEILPVRVLGYFIFMSSFKFIGANCNSYSILCNFFVKLLLFKFHLECSFHSILNGADHSKTENLLKALCVKRFK